MGDRAWNCIQALKKLKKVPGIFLEASSHVYLTQPIGFSSSQWFYNLVVKIKTIYSPWEILLILLLVELELGRKRRGKMEDRIIDLDLLLYEKEIILTKVLSIPHPFMHQRLFVLKPLVELNPTGKHPLLKRSFQEFIEEINSSQKLKKLKIDLGACID